jgi:hypothetical protein
MIMTKNYFYIILLSLGLFSVSVSAQDSKQTKQDTTIDGLSFYPNPVSNGKIYITSKTGLEKDILIYDVLGKLVFQTTTSSKELNISALSAGVYIIKIREGELSATKKLIVR